MIMRSVSIRCLAIVACRSPGSKLRLSPPAKARCQAVQADEKLELLSRLGIVTQLGHVASTAFPPPPTNKQPSSARHIQTLLDTILFHHVVRTTGCIFSISAPPHLSICLRPNSPQNGTDHAFFVLFKLLNINLEDTSKYQ